MSEKIELHLRYDWGTPQEMLMTVYVDQERIDKILAIQKEKKLNLTDAFDLTEE
jgi:hypothetical protein